MNRFALTILIAIFSSAALAGDPQPSEAPSISAVELHDKRTSGKAPVVIDVRTPAEYAAGHVPGAINIPFDQMLFASSLSSKMENGNPKPFLLKPIEAP